jgi:hypothetical protein
MATKLAEYKFTNWDDWSVAKSHLYDEVGSNNYGESIRSEGSNPYWITIWDDCNDPRTASAICKANEGEIYK